MELHTVKLKQCALQPTLTYKVAAVALANKMARTIWALLIKGGTYQAPAIMAKA
ncbi:hypothetical protein SAMN03080618_02922 [Aquamicrobium aerolatum DSM 21857]|uniref:Transposase n=1 Tax=Aquamicrobium aerolatum DSM 21857 TaxID=1121003 RepID=A0A1I3RAF6_9HYPH|nr:hypothetical protein [Aquamicrobium aerolatum]SFJ42307.1 hypothetical protein SAMN03080618_02922 [Aquamicrobium aerolatum DSM 21857]